MTEKELKQLFKLDPEEVGKEYHYYGIPVSSIGDDEQAIENAMDSLMDTWNIDAYAIGKGYLVLRFFEELFDDANFDELDLIDEIKEKME